MSNFPIGFGNFYNSYLYLLGAVLFKFLEEYLIKIKDITKTDKNMLGVETAFRNHKLIQYLYSNFGYIIFGLIFFYLSKRNKTKKSEIDITRISKKEKPLIYKKISFSKNKLKHLLIVGFLFTFQIILRRIASSFAIGDFDLWIFNIIFILIFMNHYFVITIYRHQKFSLIFIFSTNLILLISLTFLKVNDSLIGENKKINLYEYVDELFGSSGYCIIIYIFYICLSCILSLGRVLSKRLMEIEYETPYRIIFIIGIIGTSLSLITLIFTSIFECKQNLKDFCKKNNNHLDSIPQYFSELKDQIVDHTFKFFVELLIVFPLYLFVSFFQFACEMLIIFHLDPNYILISDCIFFGLRKIMKIITRSIDVNYFIIDFIAEICALLGYIVFLEIIVLKFFGLNKDIKANIMRRGVRDSKIKELDLSLESLFYDEKSKSHEDIDKDNYNEDINDTTDMEMTSIIDE